MDGPKGELHLKVRVEMQKDVNRVFAEKQSYQFFVTQSYLILTLHTKLQTMKSIANLAPLVGIGSPVHA